MRSPSRFKFCVCVPLLVVFAGCETTPVDNREGRQTTYYAPDSPGPVQGAGMESQDIISMSDRMVRDLLQQDSLVNRPTPPRIIIDSEYFRNEGSTRVNRNLITDRLRVNLNRASEGRLIFVGREYADMVEEERRMKREGETDGGTIRAAEAVAGADFRLGGRIATRDSVNPETGMRQQWGQITFEMIDLENGTIVWSNLYDYGRASQDDIIYR